MKIEGTRFGIIEFEQDDVVQFGEGLIGFPELRQYVLLNHKPESPFRWLQSLEEPSLAFLVTDPIPWVEEYSPDIPDEVGEALGISSEDPVLVYTTAAIPPGSPTDMTINLAAPIVVNPVSREGFQVVLDNEAYTMKYRVFDQSKQTNEEVAA